MTDESLLAETQMRPETNDDHHHSHHHLGNECRVQVDASQSGREESVEEGDSIELRSIAITKTIEWRVQEEALRGA